MTLTIMQALQLAGILPSLVIILVLLITSERKKLVLVPCLYFLFLAVSFSVPLQEHITAFNIVDRLQLVSLFFEASLPVISFLLIIQFVTGDLPRARYWLIFALPLIGAAPFIYSATVATNVCLFEDTLCTSTHVLRQLYMLFGASFLFLLLVTTFSRIEAQIRLDDVNRRHKYWLIIALIVMNLILLITVLAELADRITLEEMVRVHTIVKLTFIYLVMTSLFRVFDRAFSLKTPLSAVGTAEVSKDVDPELVQKLEQLLSTEKPYRKMGFTRNDFALALSVPEHVLSKTINRYYEMNFNELINSYRIEEAKERLTKEDTTITVIAFEVGFNSIASFNRVFKQKVGISPTEHRNKANA